MIYGSPVRFAFAMLICKFRFVLRANRRSDPKMVQVMRFTITMPTIWWPVKFLAMARADDTEAERKEDKKR
jgi:hypothetical protein